MRWVAAIAVVAIMAGVARAENPHLLRAESALEDLDYIVARTELTRALKLGTSGPSELARIYLLSGIVAGAFGESRAAREQFQRALALRPHARLPAGFAPKIADPFERAKESSAPLVFDCATGALDIVEDPLDMVDAIDASDSFTVAVDEYGNQLSPRCPKPVKVVVRRRMPPPGRRKIKRQPVAEEVIGPFPAERDEGTAPKRSVIARWQLWGGFAMTAGAIGSYYANDVSAGGADNAKYQKYAFGTAAVCAAAAVVLALDERRDRKRARLRAAIAPTPTSTTVWVAVDF